MGVLLEKVNNMSEAVRSGGYYRNPDGIFVDGNGSPVEWAVIFDIECGMVRRHWQEMYAPGRIAESFRSDVNYVRLWAVEAAEILSKSIPKPPAPPEKRKKRRVASPQKTIGRMKNRFT
jgi:hypothetical protein